MHYKKIRDKVMLTEEYQYLNKFYIMNYYDSGVRIMLLLNPSYIIEDTHEDTEVKVDIEGNTHEIVVMSYTGYKTKWPKSWSQIEEYALETFTEDYLFDTMLKALKEMKFEVELRCRTLQLNYANTERKLQDNRGLILSKKFGF